ncbi:MAG TPA: asparagine synthetase B [Cyclobacteriaceae bacterium]|nr:asparagine synthetase B [Cyclobacteriaceae bacterium]
MTSKKWSFFVVLVLMTISSFGNSILIPMDVTQKNHLKAYGIAYKVLKDGMEVDWLLNYRGGSFLVKYSQSVETECNVRGVSFELISDSKTSSILQQIGAPEVNQNNVKLQKAPRIAVYSPRNILITDNVVQLVSRENDDAVLLVLDYAEIPYDIVYDEQILKGEMIKYDWLHLHHEDFTGQNGRFRRESYEEVKMQEATAWKLGFKKVSQMKLQVAKTIRDFTAAGGFLFAMCSGGETFDIALAADGVDIVDSNYDGDGMDPDAQSKLDYNKTFAFENFTLDMSGYGMGFSDINSSIGGGGGNFGGRGGFGDRNNNDYFTLFNFSAKWDIIPTMLTQDHEFVIKGFFGQTPSFTNYTIKPNVLVMAENKIGNSARYIYGEFGKGQFTFYGGHDPEGNQGGPGGGGGFGGGGFGGGGGGGRVKRDLNLYPNSPGYRLILNNVLFPSAKQKKRKT